MAKQRNKKGSRNGSQRPKQAVGPRAVPAPLGPSGDGAAAGAQEPDAQLQAEGLPEGISLDAAEGASDGATADLPWFMLATIQGEEDAMMSMADWTGYATAAVQSGSDPAAAAAVADQMMHAQLQRLTLLMHDFGDQQAEGGEDAPQDTDPQPAPVADAPLRDVLDS